jgi:hypothetical protein
VAFFTNGNCCIKIRRCETDFRSWPIGFTSIKWTVELSPHCPLLELHWADITNVTVSALAIVKTFNVVEHVRTSLIPRPVLTTPDPFTFQAGKEALNHRIVITAAGTTQTAVDAMLLK